MTYREAAKLNDARAAIISENRARRMRAGEKKPPLPVPPIAVPHTVPVAYEPDGTYYGRLENWDDCPADCKVVWEAPTW